MGAWSQRDAVWRPWEGVSIGPSAVLIRSTIKARFDTCRFVRKFSGRWWNLCVSRLERLTSAQATGVGSPNCLESDDFVIVSIEISHRSGEIRHFWIVLQDPVRTGRASLLVLVVNRLRGNTLGIHQFRVWLSACLEVFDGVIKEEWVRKTVDLSL